MKVVVSITFVLLSTLCGCECFFWRINWPWRSASANENRAIEFVGDVPVPNVPYEAKSDDEKFLEAAKKYTNLQLSELDTCQHKIVLQIRTSCSEMTEEDLAKMSVNLLNCQSAVEGRQQFTCTNDMALKDCTSGMDPDMWNAYHLVSNRARAVCYSARQQQFRAQSDIAVNKLMETAYSQLNSLEKLKEGQQKLGSFTAQTLQNVASGQESLLQQQERMSVTQQNLKVFVGQNLRELTKEKALIAAGHKELGKLTEDIKTRLDSANAQLLHQSSEQQDNHKKLVEDLESIKEQAKVLWNQIEESTQKILAQHDVATVKYEETLDRLQKINETVKFLLNLMETMHDELNERLGWLNGVVGAAGIYTFFMHIAYLLLGMIATAYVHAPAFTRLCLLGIVPLNLAVLYHHGSNSALDYISMTLIIIVSTAVHWFTVSVLTYANGRSTSLDHSYTGIMLNGKVHTATNNANLQCQMKSLWSRLKDEMSKCISQIQCWTSKISSSNLRRYPSEVRKDDVNYHNDDEHSDDGSEGDISVGSLPRHRSSLSVEQRFHPIVRDSVTPLRSRITLSDNFSPPTPPRSTSSSNATRRAGTSRQGTPRPLCIATCRNGLLCRNNAVSGNGYCRIHEHDSTK